MVGADMIGGVALGMTTGTIIAQGTVYAYGASAMH
jgi:hypothetical protein